METTTNNEEVKTKRKSGKFHENSVFIRISFIIGIATIILLGIYICTGGFLLQYGKLPLYLVSIFLLVLTFVGIIFGGSNPLTPATFNIRFSLRIK